MEALLMLVVCIWRKYPGSIIWENQGGRRAFIAGDLLAFRGMVIMASLTQSIGQRQTVEACPA